MKTSYYVWYFVVVSWLVITEATPGFGPEDNDQIVNVNPEVYPNIFLSLSWGCRPHLFINAEVH